MLQRNGNSLSKNPPAYDGNIEDEDSTKCEIIIQKKNRNEPEICLLGLLWIILGLRDSNSVQIYPDRLLTVNKTNSDIKSESNNSDNSVEIDPEEHILNRKRDLSVSRRS